MVDRETRQSAPDNNQPLVYWIDDKARLVDVSLNVRSALGYSREELFAMRLGDISPSLQSGHWQDHLDQLREKKSVYLESIQRRKDGTEYPVEIIASIHAIEGQEYICFVVTDVSNKERYEGLLQSKLRWEALARNSPQCSLAVDKNLKIVFVNHAMPWRETTDIIGKYLPELTPEYETEIITKLTRLLASGEPVQYDTHSYSEGGEIHYCENHASKLPREIDTAVILINVTEITEIKHREKEFKEANVKLNASQELAGMGDFTWEIETGRIRWSKGMYKLLKYELDETLDFDKVNINIHHPEDLPRITQWLNDSINSNLTEISNEYRLVAKDGEVIYARIKGLIERQDGKAIKVFGICQDITEQRRTEAALRQSEERFSLAMKGSNDGVFDWDIKNNSTYYSDRWREMLDYRNKGPSDYRSLLIKLIHPEDSPRVLKLLDEYIEHKRDNFAAEFRMQHSQGHWIDILSRAHLVRDEEDNAERMVGTYMDISDLKAALRQIEIERNRAQHYLDIAGVILIALDDKGVITLINNKGCEILELPEEDILGKDWFINFLAEESRLEIRNVYNQLMNGEIESSEYHENHILTGTGKARLIAWHNSVVYDESSNIIGILSSGEDITEHRAAEQSLKEERTFLQSIIDGVPDPIMVIDPTFKVLRLNRVAYENSLTKFPPDKAISCRQVFHHGGECCDVDMSNCPALRVMSEKKTVKIIHPHINSKGQKLQIEITASPMMNETGEIQAIIEVSRDLTEHFKLLDELKARELSYAHLAQHDPLTELPNRLLFNDRLNHALRYASRNNTFLAILFIDLDDFKNVNDSFDHSFGDMVIRKVANRLKSVLREEDTLARMGGDEFTIILSDIHHKEDAAVVAQKTLALFDEPFAVKEHSIFLSTSIGISIFPDHGTATDDLIRNADAAMYLAKSEGGKTFRYYSEELTLRALERILLKTSLRDALNKEQLVLHYQPQFKIETGEISGIEALVRWHRPGVGVIFPDKFIPLAEETGLILPLGDWILKESCRQMKYWLDNNQVSQDCRISVNLSARQLDQHKLLEQLQGTLAETGLPPENLELEITESAMIRSPNSSADVLQEIRKMGIKIAIDDFGTGYSSLSHLKLLPFTKLKIDKSFVSDIPQDPNGIAITQTVIALAKSLSIEVLAEGVETRAQWQFLESEGCNSGQGYIFAHPLPSEGFEAFLENAKNYSNNG